MEFVPPFHRRDYGVLWSDSKGWFWHFDPGFEFRLLAQAAVRATPRLRPNYVREPTFEVERPLSPIFVGCTFRCGRSQAILHLDLGIEMLGEVL